MTVTLVAGCDPRAFATLEREIFPRPWRASSFEDRPDRLAFTLREEASCVGFIYGGQVSDEVELWRIAVAAHLRRQGHAARLYRTFREHAWLRNAETIFLEVSAHNFAAIRFYIAMGLVEVGRRKGYYGPGEDAILMRADRTGP